MPMKSLNEDVKSIPIYKEQNPYKKIYANLKKSFKNTPEYVLKDFYINQILGNKDVLNNIINNLNGNPIPTINNWYYNYLNGPWELKIIKVNPEDFDDNTINGFLDRDFGNENTYQVKGDEERTQLQRTLASKDATNEPIIVIYDNKSKKYRLIEGWHRTMSILLLGDNGEDLKNWEKVKIRAFVLSN